MGMHHPNHQQMPYHNNNRGPPPSHNRDPYGRWERGPPRGLPHPGPYQHRGGGRRPPDRPPPSWGPRGGPGPRGGNHGYNGGGGRGERRGRSRSFSRSLSSSSSRSSRSRSHSHSSHSRSHSHSSRSRSHSHSSDSRSRGRRRSRSVSHGRSMSSRSSHSSRSTRSSRSRSRSASSHSRSHSRGSSRSRSTSSHSRSPSHSRSHSRSSSRGKSRSRSRSKEPSSPTTTTITKQTTVKTEPKDEQEGPTTDDNAPKDTNSHDKKDDKDKKRSRSSSHNHDPKRSRRSSRHSKSTSRERPRKRNHEDVNHNKDETTTNNQDNSDNHVEEDNSPLTKDQRTIFVSQLVMRAEERDLRRYFRSVIGRSSSACVKDVILLRDKRTGRHKGIAYVELARLSHVPTAVAMNGQVPDFQRFPILIKANNNHHPTQPQDSSLSSPMTAMMGGALLPGSTPGMIMTNTMTSSTPLLGTMSVPSSLGMMVGGVQHVAQKVYVGNIDRAVSQAQLYALFSQFGSLDKVLLQMDPATGLSKGFAFLTFPDPNIAYLAIQTMSGQPLAGRPL
eukprot:scaffold49240_cov65-Attheya_sp.AAC.1